ncbi:MAG TPA: His/Gly/Thr/Pro-type tRNA ligase C-terminal domain-containing protein [Kofleriaceae bacterium]|nr:His/Gly/Thr/Pro-type tRNA ligase C-terminal domain-containing protein [Kofleriaceae bacterium]
MAGCESDDGTLSRRIAMAHHDGVPLAAIVGDREVQAGTLSIRARDGQFTAPVSDAIAELARRAAASAAG